MHASFGNLRQTHWALDCHKMAGMSLQGATSELTYSADRAAEQLNRILASKAFRQASRLQSFLSFVVKETLAGRAEGLKEFAVGVEVFGKDPAFNPQSDPIVRVQARRLRAQSIDRKMENTFAVQEEVARMLGLPWATLLRYRARSPMR
jgi:hypothetical protein